MNSSAVPIRVIDSHTAGEPTRVIVSGGPDLGTGTVRERADRFRQCADTFRCLTIHEPRGSDALVGALLCEPADRSCVAGVIFFNNSGFLGMCGHGAIGVVVTLAYLHRIDLGKHRLETPVGIVEVELLEPNRVAIQNVPSYRHRHQVQLQVDGLGTVTGDVAWGGNWFFLVQGAPVPLQLQNVRQLSDAARRIRAALQQQQITGEQGAEIDHIEFFGPPQSADAHSRNFVFCPGEAYDRSPCGTGTSAKLACLAADGKLQPGERWIQESLIGSCFTGTYHHDESGRIIPRIAGSAYVCGEGILVQHPEDPYRHGIPSAMTKFVEV